ncbi:MAG: hypothetical protein JRI72_14985 [Deltaproteobacteria bacterium]|nr:hypothetical protein [Deltaproteobacteria bacterium]
MKKGRLIIRVFIFSIFLAVCFALLGKTLNVLAEQEAAIAQDRSRELRKFSGSLDIRIHPQEGKLEPSVEFVVSDPRQRRAGWDSKTGKVILDIPGSSYETEGIDDAIEGELGPETLILYLAKPIPGDYALEVIGRESGSYSLEIQAYDCEMNPSRAMFIDVNVTEGVVHRYGIKYSNIAGEMVESYLIGGNEGHP